MSAFFAITSAFLYGLTNVMAKTGMRASNTSAAVFISLLVSFFSVLIFSLFYTSFNQYLTKAAFFFLTAGIIGPFIGRILLFKGIDRVGAAISSTLYEDKPLFSVVGAMILLGERLTPTIGLGVCLMLAGTIIVSFERSGGQIEKKWKKIDLLIPMAAGACYGISQVFRKMGLNISPNPVVGVMVQNVGAIVFMPLLVLPGKSQKGAISRSTRVWVLFLFVGLLQVVAQWCLFKALNLGSVVIVSPLSSLSTFFVLILTVLFLRKLERVTWKIVLGAVLMVGATVILTVRT